MILDRLHYVQMGWWRWAQVRFAIFSSRFNGGHKKRISLNQHFQTVTYMHENLRLKPKVKNVINLEEMELARKSCPVDAISGQGKHWNIDPLRCHSCHLCIKLAPQSLELEENASGALKHFNPQEN